MASLLRRVKARVALASSRKTLHPLEGAHAAVRRGRSLDFDDLRHYEPGDEVRDIDWRATARQGQLLVKQYVATRRYSLALAVDTSPRMSALAADGTPKRDLAVLAAGVLGFLSLRNGDEVRAFCGEGERIRRTPAGGSEGRLEQLLRTIDRSVAGPAATRAELLAAVARDSNRRLILAIIGDESPLLPEEIRQLRRLRARHEVLWFTICEEPLLDHAPRSRPRVDIDSGWEIPEFLASDPALLAELEHHDRDERERRTAAFAELGIDHRDLHTDAEVVPVLLDVLERRRRARR